VLPVYGGRFEPALAEAPIACHEIDLGARIVRVNAAECRLLGLPQQELLGRDISDFVAPEEREASRAAVRRKLACEQFLRPFEREYERPDGTRLKLEIHETYILAAGGRIAGIRSFLLDITARKRAEEALRAGEHRYRHLVEHASDIIYLADLSGRFTFFNPTATRILGYPPEELMGCKYLDLIRPDYRNAAQAFYRRQLAERIPNTYFEFPAVARDGSEVWFGQNVQLVEEHGRIVGVQAVTRDITRQRLAGEELKKAREELEARVLERTQELELANQFLRREMEERKHAEQERRRLEAQIQHAQRLESLAVLAGGIAHDFNNLLTNIMGYASMALAGLPHESEARTYMEQVMAAAKNGAELNRQILAYSGGGKFVIEPIHVSQLIEEGVRLLGTLISKQVSLEVDLAPDVPPVNADAAQLRQVVMNLVANASEALGDTPGVIRVTTGCFWAGEGELSGPQPGHSLPAGQYAYLEVKDTGCGMDEETLSRMFEPFFSTKFTGRGLGLAAVLGIVRGHGGTVQVESAPGAGTTFRAIFPCAVTGAAAEEELPADLGWHAEGLVLVVDDDPEIRSLARRVLERAGLTVLTAANGEEALARFSDHADDIRAVLLDLIMPGLEGDEVVHQLNGIRPDVKVVLCSGFEMADVEDQISRCATAGFLRKPYQPAQLIDAMRTIL
jgi:PAS domain S-box-containing protein